MNTLAAYDAKGTCLGLAWAVGLAAIALAMQARAITVPLRIFRSHGLSSVESSGYFGREGISLGRI
jgi:hypothetical protein